MNLWEWDGIWGTNAFILLAETEMLWMLYLHGEEFQVLCLVTDSL